MPSKAATGNPHVAAAASPRLRMLRGTLGISLKFPASELQCGSTAANKSVRERTPFREGMENKNTDRRNNHVQSVRTEPAWQCCSDYQTSQPGSEISRQPALPLPAAAMIFFSVASHVAGDSRSASEKFLPSDQPLRKFSFPLSSAASAIRRT